MKNFTEIYSKLADHFGSEVYGKLSVIFTWAATAITFLQGFDMVIRIVATIAALVVSIITARYYWHKTKKLKEDGKL